jgi:hypothetical protein
MDEAIQLQDVPFNVMLSAERSAAVSEIAHKISTEPTEA